MELPRLPLILLYGGEETIVEKSPKGERAAMSVGSIQTASLASIQRLKDHTPILRGGRKKINNNPIMSINKGENAFFWVLGCPNNPKSIKNNSKCELQTGKMSTTCLKKTK